MSESNLKRFGVSMDEPLLKEFDELIKRQGYENHIISLGENIRMQPFL